MIEPAISDEEMARDANRRLRADWLQMMILEIVGSAEVIDQLEIWNRIEQNLPIEFPLVHEAVWNLDQDGLITVVAGAKCPAAINHVALTPKGMRHLVDEMDGGRW